MTVLTPLLTPMVLVYHECKTVFLSSVWSAPIIQGRIQVGVIEAIAPRKRTKTTLFTMIFTIRKTAFAIYGHFGVHCFVTAVLWSILHVSCSSKLVMRLSWQPNITKNTTPKHTGWIHPCHNSHSFRIYMFSNNVDLKTSNRNYRKPFWILCVREQLQYISFKSILINREITYDTVMQGHLCHGFPLFQRAGRAVPP